MNEPPPIPTPWPTHSALTEHRAIPITSLVRNVTVVSLSGDDGEVKTRTLLILAALTGTAILVAGALQIFLAR